MSPHRKSEGFVTRSFDRMVELFQYEIWDTEAKSVFSLPYRFLRILYLSVRGFRKDRCQLMATSLTYISLLSIVPLLAFAFSVSKGLKAQNVWLRDWVATELSGALQEVATQILDRVEQINVAALGAIGFVILLAVVLKMVGTIERSFNVIWGVRKARSFVRKITDYVSMVILGPIFLITIIGLTTLLTNSAVVETLLKTPVIGEIRLLRFLAPYMIVWVGFTFLYIFLPNTRVRIVPALIAGVTAGTLWEITLKAYIWSQIGVGKYTALYGAFAAIPIFLIWVNLSWVIVLIGAEICFAIQNEKTYIQEVQTAAVRRQDREALALHLCARITQRFASGQRGWTAADLSNLLDAPIRLINEITGKLIEGGCLEETRSDEPALVPARDPSCIEVREVLDIVGEDQETPREETLGRIRRPPSAVEELLEDLRSARDNRLAGITLADLARRMPTEPGAGVEEVPAEGSPDLEIRPIHGPAGGGDS
jgi:membrane protein